MVKPPAVVSVKRVTDYDPARLLASMRACLEPLGGMKAFVRPGQRVLLKPNLLGGFAPERAVTTHPAVVRAAILLVQEAGGQARVGDSPALGALPAVARAAGLAAVLDETGAQLLDLSEPHEFETADHRVARRITLAKALLETDVLISLPKLKTHGQMILTASLKNQFGLIPGALKSQWHFRLQQPAWLASLILEVNRLARPVLTILDAVVAMEGQGPTSGKPRLLGALLASPDLAAADTLACHLIGQAPLRVPLLAAAREQAYGETDVARIRVAGDDWQALCAPGFEKIEQGADLLRLLPLPKPALRWLSRQWTLLPRIVDGRCTHCGICEEGCPLTPAAIHPDAPATGRVEEDRCIHCYCCHEFCPSQGIELHQPWLARHLPLTAMADRAARLFGVLSRLGRR
jgi:uncharacterized protein (DUF362 family)